MKRRGPAGASLPWREVLRGAAGSALRALRLRRRAKARAHHPHPPDLALALGQVGLLLDQEPAVGIADSEAVSDPLAVDDGVGLHPFDALDLVLVLEPVPEYHVDDRLGVRRLPV